MDLSQTKLTKREWDAIELPVSDKEKSVLSMIVEGYSNINIRSNANMSMTTFLRMTPSPEMDDHIYSEYFAKQVSVIDADFTPLLSSKKLKKAELMKFDLNKPDSIKEKNIYELKLLACASQITKAKASNVSIQQPYFTLYHLNKTCVPHINGHIRLLVNNLLTKYENALDFSYLIYNAEKILEKNQSLIENADISLYSHQKEIFRSMRNTEFTERQEAYKELSEEIQHVINPEDEEDGKDLLAELQDKMITLERTTSSNMVLYSAPTGMGKTMTPLALTQSYRVIFVCAARHVGLALAKNAISIGRKVAFAFGCESSDDIRLHYSAASVYTTNKRTGKIAKVDNSAGEKVELMICDVKSYLIAMYYMKAFNPLPNLLMFWDEPTISLDYQEHPLHEHIHNVWKNNKVSNVVLSSATLPRENISRNRARLLCEIHKCKYPNHPKSRFREIYPPYQQERILDITTYNKRKRRL